MGAVGGHPRHQPLDPAVPPPERGLAGGHRARRLATLPWLGLSGWEEMDWRRRGEGALAECAAYFRPAGVPYRRWFDPFDRRPAGRARRLLLRRHGACHLNLVPWATDPVWRGLDRGAWRRLLDAELPFRRRALARGRPTGSSWSTGARPCRRWRRRTGRVVPRPAAGRATGRRPLYRASRRGTPLGRLDVQPPEPAGCGPPGRTT